MNLLPKSKVEFSEKNYWEKFFKSRSQSFEWYGEYINMIDIFKKYVKSNDFILISGCGNSSLSYDLYVKQNCSKVLSIDISKTVIDQMLSKHEKIISKINKNDKIFDFKCMDVCNFSKDEEIKQFLPVTCIIDKGTTDAIHTGENLSEDVIISMWAEIDKNLSVLGRYILITLAQNHIVESITKYFLKPNNNQWMVKVHELFTEELGNKRFILPVFVFVFYKMKPSPSLPLVNVEEDGFANLRNITKLTNPITDLKHWINDRQQLSMLSHSIQESKECESIINMVSSQSGLTRYHCIFVSDKAALKKKSKSKLLYCVFIVPFGFNCSPIINSPEARLKMCRNHLESRECLFVFLNGREYYTDRQMIQDELKSIAVKFCPNSVPSDYSIPYVSCNDFVYNSVITNEGHWMMESIDTSEGQTFYRLLSIFEKKVIVCSHSLTLRDRINQKCLETLSEIIKIGENRGTYFGHIFGTEYLKSNKYNLNIYAPGIDSIAMKLIKERFSINCISNFETCKEFDWAICDFDVINSNLIKDIVSRLSNPGILILSCEDYQNLILTDFSLTENFSGLCEDPLSGNKIKFAILSKGKVDISTLLSVLNEICY